MNKPPKLPPLDTLKRLNQLFEESIIQVPDNDVLHFIEQNPNTSFAKHIERIKSLNKK